jgi:DNA-binding GntR family transcriptional regulator
MPEPAGGDNIVKLNTARRRQGTLARIHAYGAILDAIVRSEFEPGRQLSENELAAWLGVSRTPVREALARLREEGLVEIVAQLGTFVAPISPRAVTDAQFVREALECAAVRKAAELATTDDIAELEGILRNQYRAVRANDHDAFYVLDDDFHHALCDISGHTAVWTLGQRIKPHLNRVRRLSLPAPSYLEEMVAEHEQVLGAVDRHEADSAETAMRHHLRMVLREIPRLREQHPEYFDE